MLDLLIQAEAADAEAAVEYATQGNPWSSLIMLFVVPALIAGFVIGLVVLIKLINRRMK